jgi:hypothetical protein
MVKTLEINIDSIFEDIKYIEEEDNTKELLKSGVPVYIKEPGMPQGIMIKIYPNGTKETVRIDENFNENVVNF